MALQTLHKNNILHCNLKPSNILVDEYGNIRLCDFKKALKLKSMSALEIKKNKSAMTPCYTAPELFSEDGGYNFKTDLWALGCIMYELAVGQVPFFDESVGKLMTKIINEDVNFNRKELNIKNFSGYALLMVSILGLFYLENIKNGVAYAVLLIFLGFICILSGRKTRLAHKGLIAFAFFFGAYK